VAFFSPLSQPLWSCSGLQCVWLYPGVKAVAGYVFQKKRAASPLTVAQHPFSQTAHTLPRRTCRSLCLSHHLSALHYEGRREETGELLPSVSSEAKARCGYFSSKFGAAAE